MSNITRIVNAVAAGESNAGSDLLPLVYDDLRKLAKQWTARQTPGQTINATALVHEAYLRVIGPDGDRNWESRRHFFAAAAQAMRCILIDRARRKSALKRGGDRNRVKFDDLAIAVKVSPEQLLALDEALDSLEEADAGAANLVKLRYFSGFSVEEAGEALGVSRATAYRDWKFAKAWLQNVMKDEE